MKVHAHNGSGFAPTFLFNENGNFYGMPTLYNEGKVIKEIKVANNGDKLYIYAYGTTNGQQSFSGVKKEDVKFGASFAVEGSQPAPTNVNVNIRKRGALKFVSGMIVGAIATWFTIAYIASKK